MVEFFEEVKSPQKTQPYMLGSVKKYNHAAHFFSPLARMTI